MKTYKSPVPDISGWIQGEFSLYIEVVLICYFIKIRMSEGDFLGFVLTAFYYPGYPGFVGIMPGGAAVNYSVTIKKRLFHGTIRDAIEAARIAHRYAVGE